MNIFVVRCQLVSTVFMYKKERKLVIEQQKFFAAIVKLHSSRSFLLLLVTVFLICQFLSDPFVGQLLL